ncbi:outer membrane protein assembly complex, YaeT protein [Treponema phagedenis F0421]|uniref:outer membrane protein assembly factor BamA n=1 Tax=Treponema phagedenis TaxID=162 RepID=UPI0001F63F28|nr:outer membrane protein assembly factor BamA [Treponema phagedenis]EFW37528.1 outer membrane protein assembly complex, YaeT protein [Treponema phagedenis F0421]
MYKKIGVILCFLFGMTVLFAEVADNWYVQKPIRGIHFEGLEHVSKAELDEIFSSYRGKKWSDDVYWEILQKLYALDYFSEIVPKAIPADPDYESVLLQFSVKEQPAIIGIKFTGNNRLRSGDLLSKILLKKGDIYNEIKLKTDEESLRKYYLEKGYAAVQLSSKVDKTADGIIIHFTITEGKQTVVSEIHFEGNTVATEKTLKKTLASQEVRFLTAGIFKESNLEIDKTAIHNYYAERGYIDAHVENIIQKIDDKTNPQKNLVSLTYVIMEGQQYLFGGVTISGNRLFSTKELESKISLKKGAVLDMTLFESGFQAIADTYFENGYTSNHITKEEHRDPSTKEVSFTITIIERARSHIENIFIRGNKKTKDSVILREMLLEPGDVFSKSKFTDSLRNLFNLRYFSSIVPDIQPGSEQDLIDIVLNLEEQSTANIQFGITFSGASTANSFPLSLFVQWEERNFLGRGSSISVNGSVATDTQSLKANYTENWFLGTPLTVGFDFGITHKYLYSNQDVLYPMFTDKDAKASKGLVPPDPFSTWEEYEANPTLAEAYKMKYNRLELDFGMHTGYSWFPRYAMITLRGGINFSLVKNFYNADLYRPSDFAVRNQQRRWSLSNVFWTGVSFDNRDFAYDPSKGWFLSEKISFFGLLPKIEDEYFFRSETKGELYFTLLNYPVSPVWNLKFVLAFYSSFSFQLPYPKQAIGENSKLLVDGIFAGFGWTSLGMAGTGDVLIQHRAEFRWPLAHGILSFDFFFDAAAVKQDLKSLKKLTINDYYFSFGPCLRFTLPQFPLRLMFANTFRSNNWKPYWGNGKGADWKFVLSFNTPNL